MHIFIEHDKNVNFFRKYIPGIYQVYTKFGNDKGIYLVYTWYIPGKTFQGFPDELLIFREASVSGGQGKVTSGQSILYMIT